MPEKDYYEILGVGRDDDEKEIRRAFRRLARKYHPDVNPGKKEAENRFKEINEAFEVLSDPEKRATYDQFGKAGLEGAGYRPGEGGFPGFEEIFKNFGFGDIFDVFSGMGGRRERTGPQQGADLKYDMEIDLEEAHSGVKRKIEVPRYEKCGECGGSGARPGTSPVKCPFCHGTGQMRTVRRSGFMQAVSVSPCQKCRGSGEIVEEPCKECGGSGRVKRSRKVTVEIPQGIEDSQYLRLDGQGEAGPRGGPAGDLYVHVRIKEHPVFERHGESLFCKTSVELPLAVLGGEIEVPTIRGKAKLKIPAGTQSHTVFRLKGQGMPFLHGRGKGDQFVKVVVKIPKKLSREQEKLVKGLDDSMGTKKATTEKGFFERLREKM